MGGGSDLPMTGANLKDDSERSALTLRFIASYKNQDGPFKRTVGSKLHFLSIYQECHKFHHPVSVIQGLSFKLSEPVG